MKVSCILPTYNRHAWLGARLTDMQLQTMPDWELIVVDDGGDSELPTEIQNVIDSDSRIRYIKLKTNSKSVTIPRNIGISYATGDYIAHIDDDVEQYPHKLELLSKALDGNPDAVLVHGNRVNIDIRTHKSQLIRTGLWSPTNGPGIDGGQIMYRASVYTKIPLVFARRACDWEVAKAVFKLGNFINIDDVVCNYIWHYENRSNFSNTQTTTIYPAEFAEYFNKQSPYILDLRPV